MRALAPPRNRAVYGLVAVLAAVTLWFALLPAAAHAKPLRLDGVRTTLTTDPATTTLLFGAGIVPLPIFPTPVVPTANAAKYSFPIIGGTVDSKTLAGQIRHSGGLLLAMRNHDDTWTALSLAKFTIRVDAEPDLSAVVNGGSRVEIATLDLGNAAVKKFVRGGRTFVSIGGVGVTLNKTATDAIDSTFGTTLPDTVKLGTAKVVARVAR